MAVLERTELERSPLADLHAIAAEMGIEGFRRLRREELIGAILGEAGESGRAGEAGEAGEGAPRARTSVRRARGRRAGRPAAGDADAVDADPSGRPRGDRLGAVEEEDAPPAPPRRRRGRRAAPSEDPDAGEGETSAAEPEPAAEEEPRSGVLDVLPNGSGFMRTDPFAHSADDVYVSAAQIRRCELRPGDELAGPVRPARRSERYPSLVRVDTVNGAEADPPAPRPRFEELTPVFATERLTAPDELDAAPFGKGSRVAVAGAPGAEATPLLRRIVAALGEAHPEVEVVVLLAGARPEDATEWRREGSVAVTGGAFDGPTEEQAQAAEMALERAKRAVERGGDAALVVDALDALPPGVARRIFGAARKAEEGGSLTVVAAVEALPELGRVATTRIVLEPADGGGEGPAAVAPSSGTTRADLLGAGAARPRRGRARGRARA